MTHSFPTRRSSDLIAKAPFQSCRTQIVVVQCGDHANTGMCPDVAPQPEAGQDSLAEQDTTDSCIQQRPIDETSRRSEEHTSELQSLMRISYAVFCLKKKTTTTL